MRIPETVREKYEAASEWVKRTLGTTRGKAIAISGGCIIIAAIVCGVAIANFPAAAGSDQTVAKQSALNVEAGSSSKDSGAKTAASSDASAASSSSSAASSSAAAASSSTASVSQTATQGSATASPANQGTTTKQSGGTTTTAKQSGGTTATTKRSGGTTTTTKRSGGTTTTTGGGTPAVNPSDPRYAAITQYNEVTYGSIAPENKYMAKGTFSKADGVAVGTEFGTGLSPEEIDLKVDIKYHTLTVYVGAQGQTAGDQLNLSLVSSTRGTIFNQSICTIDGSTGIVRETISLPTYSAGSAGTWLSPATYTLTCSTQHGELNRGSFPVDERGLE